MNMGEGHRADAVWQEKIFQRPNLRHKFPTCVDPNRSLKIAPGCKWSGCIARMSAHKQSALQRVALVPAARHGSGIRTTRQTASPLVSAPTTETMVLAGSVQGRFEGLQQAGLVGASHLLLQTKIRMYGHETFSMAQRLYCL